MPTDFFSSGNQKLKFIINIFVVFGLVYSAIFFPVNSRINAVEKKVESIQKDHDAHCQQSRDILSNRVTEKDLEKSLKPIKESINDVKRSINAFHLKNETFQEQLFQLILELKE